MKRVFILLIAILALFSCHRKLTKDGYVKGMVIYRAESNFPVGLIKIEDIHEQKLKIDTLITTTRNNNSDTIIRKHLPPPIESPSRAVFYEFNDTLPLNLYEEVWFQIRENGNFQSAYNITNDSSNLREKLMNDRDKFFLLSKINLNLHNGDKHREGPKHKRIHALKKPRLNYFTVQNNPNIAILRYMETETGIEDSVYIRSSDVPFDTTRSYFIQFDVVIDGFSVHTLDLNHIH